SDNDGQAARVRDLIGVVDRRVAILKRGVEAARAGDFAAARRNAVVGEGLTAMTDIEARADAIIALENPLLEQRTQTARGTQGLALTIGLAMSLLALAGLTAGIIVLAEGNRRLSDAVAETGRAQADLASADALTRAIFANAPDYLIVLAVEPNDR